MDEIKNFKMTLENYLGKTIIYEMNVDLKKEKIIKVMGQDFIEKELESNDFEQKKDKIENCITNIDSEYINNKIIDGIEIKINIDYMNNKTKKIVCKNEIPKEVQELIEIINI